MNANSEDATVFCPLEGENVRVAEACVDCPYWDGSRCEALSRSPKRSAKKLRSRQRRTSFTTRGGGRARMPLVGGKWPFGRAAHEEGIISGSSLIPQPPDYTGADRFFEEPEVEVEPEDDDDEKEEIDRGVVGLERPMGGLTYREELELETRATGSWQTDWACLGFLKPSPSTIPWACLWTARMNCPTGPGPMRPLTRREVR